jgi:hypothetical protein
LNVCGFNDIRQIEMHSAKSLIPKCSSFEVEIAFETLKRYKLPGIDQILMELNPSRR